MELINRQELMSVLDVANRCYCLLNALVLDGILVFDSDILKIFCGNDQELTECGLHIGNTLSLHELLINGKRIKDATENLQ